MGEENGSKIMETESKADQMREEHLIFLQDVINERNDAMGKAMKLKGLKIDLAERWAKAESSQAKEMAEYEKQKLAWKYESEIIENVLKSRHLLGNISEKKMEESSSSEEDIEIIKKQLKNHKNNRKRSISDSREQNRSRKTSESNSSHKSKNHKNQYKKQKPVLLEDHEPYAIFELMEDDIENDWKFLNENCLKGKKTEKLFEEKTEEEFVGDNLKRMQEEMKTYGVDKLSSVEVLKGKHGRNSSYSELNLGHVIFNSNSNSSMSNHQWPIDGLLIPQIDNSGYFDGPNSVVVDKKLLQINGRVFFEGSNIKLKVSSIPSSTISGCISNIGIDQFTIEYEGKRQVFCTKNLLAQYKLVM